MYQISSNSFLKRQKIEVPRYRIDAFNGKNLELSQEPRRMEVDVSAFDVRSVAQARSVHPEGWEIRGLIALDSVPFAHALVQAAGNGHARRFGTVLGDAWYLLAPINLQFTPRAGGWVVVGLYR